MIPQDLKELLDSYPVSPVDTKKYTSEEETAFLQKISKEIIAFLHEIKKCSIFSIYGT